MNKTLALLAALGVAVAAPSFANENSAERAADKAAVSADKAAVAKDAAVEAKDAAREAAKEAPAAGEAKAEEHKSH